MEITKNKQKSGKTCFEIMMMLLFGLIFAVCSGVFTNNSSLYNDEECVDLLNWSKAFFIFLCVVSGFALIFIIILIYKGENSYSESQSLKSFYYYFKVLASIAFCILIIGLAYSYELYENCGYLKIYILVILIITIIFLGFYALGMIFGCIGAIWISIKLKREAKKTEIAEKFKNSDFLEAELS